MRFLFIALLLSSFIACDTSTPTPETQAVNQSGNTGSAGGIS
jgi:hypothetical protein